VKSREEEKTGRKIDRKKRVGERRKRVRER
jgi:hypothetical protein